MSLKTDPGADPLSGEEQREGNDGIYVDASSDEEQGETLICASKEGGKRKKSKQNEINERSSHVGMSTLRFSLSEAKAEASSDSEGKPDDDCDDGKCSSCILR